MNKDYMKRFEDLIAEGKGLHAGLPFGGDGATYWVEDHRIALYQKWIASVLNLVLHLAPADSHFAKEADRIQKHEDFSVGVASHLVRQTYGLLEAAADNFKEGLLSRVEYVVAGATFDDFLDHAQTYHGAGMKDEAAVLWGAAFEDTMKKIAAKHSVPSGGLTLDPLIDSMVKAGVFDGVRAKRLKAYAGTRNAALHADWAKVELKAVGEAITGTRELITGFLI